ILVLIVATLVLTINRTVSLTVPSIIILGLSAFGSYLILRAIWLGFQSLAHRPEMNLRLTLSPSQSPAFWQLNQEVAECINTRPIQTVYLIPDAQIAVKERRNFFARMRDRQERCLALGLGAIDPLSQAQLKAILAHEYSHLQYRDVGLGRGVAF